MTLNLTPEEDILSRVQTNVLSRTYDTEVPEGTTPAYPYVVVYFGTPVRSASDHHITSTRNDTLIGYVTVQVISKDAVSARAIASKAQGELTGYRPVDSGEMILDGGTAYSRVATDTKPTRFYRELAFSYRTNLTFNN